MAQPTTREEFKEFCLRALGKPVIEINVDDTQVDDRVDEALEYFYDYHFSGSDIEYYKHEIDANTVENKYIDLPENIIGAVKIFEPANAVTSSSDLFNARYQVSLNELYTLNNMNLIGYYSTMTHLGIMEELLVGLSPIRFNRHRNRLHLDIDKNKLTVGQYLLVEAYSIVDPTEYPDVWKDRWLQRYTTQLIKRQWATNLSKFEGMQLPGGIQFNAQKLYDDAQEQITKLEDEMLLNYSLPVEDRFG